MTDRDRAMLDTFCYFRQVWSPRASYHLARVRYGRDWRERLASAFWLMRESIAYSGAAPSLNFPGLPRHFGEDAIHD